MEKLKHLPIFVISLPIIAWSLFLIFSDQISPETQLLGHWKESKWEYAKNDRNIYSDTIEKSTKDELYELMGDKIKIHQAEKWIFSKNRKLEILKLDGSSVFAKWIIKGRGHILRIVYPDQTEEYYDIKELNNNHLELHFDIGMEVRGIAKLTFDKELI